MAANVKSFPPKVINRGTSVILGLILAMVLVVQASETSPGTQLASHFLDDLSSSNSGSDVQSSSSNVGHNPSKRAARPSYSFGLGKKSDPELEQLESQLQPEYFDTDSLSDSESMMPTWSQIESAAKRSKVSNLRTFMAGQKSDNARYGFGLGKRGWKFAHAIPEPLYLNDMKRRYSFGLGKK